MAKCSDCLHFSICRHYVDADETFPEVGGCSAFKSKGDVVKVVRCKDCRKCSIYDDAITGQKEYVCRLWHGATREVDADSFCDAGERKENV